MKTTTKPQAGSLKKFMRGLLTTTCLTAAATGAAHASILNETSVAGADFGDTFALLNSLGSGVTEVIGQINPSFEHDYFSISGLAGGTSYTITGLYTGSASYEVLTSGNLVLNSINNNPASMSGTIPGDGILVVHVAQNEQISTYDLTLTAASSGVPEPGTLAGAGLAVASGIALRRKLKK